MRNTLRARQADFKRLASNPSLIFATLLEVGKQRDIIKTLLARVSRLEQQLAPAPPAPPVPGFLSRRSPRLAALQAESTASRPTRKKIGVEETHCLACSVSLIRLYI